jgi:hypothetical protein
MKTVAFLQKQQKKIGIIDPGLITHFIAKFVFTSAPAVMLLSAIIRRLKVQITYSWSIHFEQEKHRYF